MAVWIERQKNIIDFTLSSLLRKKGKNLLLIIVYTFVVFLLASVMFFTYSVRQEASLILKESPEMVIQRIVGGRHEMIPLSYADKIKGIKGVRSVRGRLWGYYYDPVTGANYTVMVPGDDQLTSGKIVIGDGVSRTRLAFEGDSIEFKTHDGVIIDLEVEKRLSQESELISSDLVLVSEDDYRMLFGPLREGATDLTLEAENPEEISAITGKISELLPDTRQILRQDILKTYRAAFHWGGGVMIALFSGALLAFIILAWDKASGLSPDEKKEIGILKAIGWELPDVILMKFWESMAISLTSFFAGIMLAYGHVFLASSFLFEPVLRGWAVLYPQLKITPFINPLQIVFLFLLSVVPYTIATIVPAWRAARIEPDSIMRA